MANLYDELGLDAATVEKDAGSQQLSSLAAPGVYDAQVKQAYIRKTDSGAKMFCMLLQLSKEKEDKGELFWETCTHAGDAKGNKATFGVNTMTYFFQACGLNNPSVAMGPIKHKQETIEAMGVPEAAGKIIKIGLKHEENLYEGSVSLRPLITAFLTDKGLNSKGEDLLEKLTKALETNPVKKLKVAANTPSATNQASAGAAAAASGW